MLCCGGPEISVLFVCCQAGMGGVGNNGVFLACGYGCAGTGFIHCSVLASL